MLVSGGQILAIDHVATNSQTITGDGTSTKIGVNTDTIATKEFTSAYVSEVSGNLQAEIDKKIDSDVAYKAFMPIDALEGVSGKWNEVSAMSAISGYGYSAWSAVSAFDIVSDTSDILSAYFKDHKWHLSATSKGGGIDLTTEQLSAISSVSGISATVNTHIDNNDVHVTIDDKKLWNNVSSISGYGYSAWSAVSAYDLSKFVSGSYLSANALNEVSGVWNQVSAISGYGYSAWSAVSAYDLSEFITPAYYSAGYGIKFTPVYASDENDNDRIRIDTSGYGLIQVNDFTEIVNSEPGDSSNEIRANEHTVSGVEYGEIRLCLEDLDEDGNLNMKYYWLDK